MDSSPRRWVLKPLSPLLHPSDLRTIAGPSQDDTCDLDVPVFSSESTLVSGNSSSAAVPPQQGDGSSDTVFQALQMSQDGGSISNEWLPSSSSNPSSPSSSLGSHCGFYSFVEDPASLEAELNEVWMVSPQRQAQLLTLKEEKEFTLQTYASSRKPESLFSKSEEDSQYKVDPEKVVRVVGQEEEKQLRKEIIRSQAPKKNLVFKDQVHMLENLDLSSSKNKVEDGLGVSLVPVISRPEKPHPAESGRTDEEHISFSAARQQFLKLEQDQLTAVLSPLSSSRTYLTSSVQRHPNNSAEDSEDKLSEEDETRRERTVTASWTKDNLSRQRRAFEAPDCSLEELSMEVDGGFSSDKVLLKDNTQLQENRSRQSIAEYETPIEREIRLVQEREADLRCSRGLKHRDSKVEMVSYFIQQGSQKKRNQSGTNPQQKAGNTVRYAPEQQQHDNRTYETSQSEFGQTDVSLSLCCPHRHPEWSISNMSSDSRDLEIQDSTSFRQPHMTSSSFNSSPSPSSQTPSSQVWRENTKTSGLWSRGQHASEFIEKEIKEAERREQELQEVRKSMVMEQTNRTAIGHFYPPVNTGHQPWTYTPPRASSSTSVAAPSPRPPVKETLLQDVENRRVLLKLEENSYAGIQLTDKVNNEVVRSTRVTRHKNQRALWWEAGVFANQEDQ